MVVTWWIVAFLWSEKPQFAASRIIESVVRDFIYNLPSPIMTLL